MGASEGASLAALLYFGPFLDAREVKHAIAAQAMPDRLLMTDRVETIRAFVTKLCQLCNNTARQITSVGGHFVDL